MDGNSEPATAAVASLGRALLRRGRLLEGITLVWNVAGIVVLAIAGLWWADPLAALVIVFYALREAREIFQPGLLASRATAEAREET